MLDSATFIAAFAFFGVTVQTVFNFLGSERARRHELEKMRLEHELAEQEKEGDE